MIHETYMRKPKTGESVQRQILKMLLSLCHGLIASKTYSCHDLRTLCYGMNEYWIWKLTDHYDVNAPISRMLIEIGCASTKFEALNLIYCGLEASLSLACLCQTCEACTLCWDRL